MSLDPFIRECRVHVTGCGTGQAEITLGMVPLPEGLAVQQPAPQGGPGGFAGRPQPQGFNPVPVPQVGHRPPDNALMRMQHRHSAGRSVPAEGMEEFCSLWPDSAARVRGRHAALHTPTASLPKGLTASSRMVSDHAWCWHHAVIRCCEVETCWCAILPVVLD